VVPLFSGAMRYTINDLVEQSGLAPRTIRKYIALGVIPRPDGNGGGALYTDHHLELVIAISRMKAQGLSLAVAVQELSTWSEPRLRRYLADTEPKEPAPPPKPAASPEPPRPPPLPEPGGAPRLPGHWEDTPRLTGKTRKKGKEAGDERKLALPAAASFKFIRILPDLFLCLDDDASPLARRMATEIYSAYAVREPRS
jgi:DNA-binding transcriptional MerR regulator